MSLFTPLSRAVLYKDSGFSSTELVKWNPRTGYLVKLSVFPAAGAGMGIHPRQKINIDFSPILSFSPFCDACPPNCPFSPNSCTERLCLPLLTMAKGKRQAICHWQLVYVTKRTGTARVEPLLTLFCVQWDQCSQVSYRYTFLFLFPMATVPAPNLYPLWHPLKKNKK